MGTLKDSMSDTVRTDIARRVVGEYQRMPYSNFTTGNSFTNFYDVEGVLTNSNAAIFMAIATFSSLTNPSSVINTDTNNGLLLSVTVRHVRDTNSRTRYSQILVNSAQ